jgi:hypothetical protein
VTQLIASVVAVLGALLGVILGSRLARRAQRELWERAEVERSREQRRRLYAGFATAARTVGPRAGRRRGDRARRLGVREPYAFGGAAQTDTLRLRAEIRLASHSTATVSATRRFVLAVSELARARGRYAAGAVPESFPDCCREAERDFATAAREELGSPVLSEPVR